MLALKKHEDNEFKNDLSKLSAALKNTVKGRHHPALLGTDDLANETSLPKAFIINVLKSRMLDTVFNIIGADISEDRIAIEVPIRYGHRPL